jgi:hypothetical protein
MWSATFEWPPRHRSASSEASLAPSPCSGWRTRPVRESLKEGSAFPAGAPSSAGSRHSCPKRCRGRSGCLEHHLFALEHEQDLRIGLKAFLKAA